jgi:hypothetical protein
VPAPVPLRVVVKGASTAVFLAETGGPRSDFNFGRVIESEILTAGRPAEVQVIAVPSYRAHFSLRNWEAEFLGYSPDVIVLHHGHYESIHFFLPRWLERHANSTRYRTSRRQAFYRRMILRKVWVTLAKIQSRVDGRISPLLFAGRLRRVAADVEALVNHLQTVGSPLILVMEVVPPGRRWQSWFPGLVERTAFVNAELEAAVRRIDRPNVRYVRTVPTLTAQLEPGDEPTPDGGHYSARAHRVLGELLSREILDWADTQPHLQVTAPPRTRRNRAG